MTERIRGFIDEHLPEIILSIATGPVVGAGLWCLSEGDYKNAVYCFSMAAGFVVGILVMVPVVRGTKK